MLKDAHGPALSEKDIAALNVRTEGWAVGLMMAGLSMRGQEDAKAFLTTFTGSQRYVMDYLVEEVLNQQSREVRDFLLQTSILERLSGPLCDCVTGQSCGQDTLISLESSFGGFLVPLDESRQWYRYHHLLAELLRHQLERTSGAEKAARLHLEASQWYEEHGFIDDAIHHGLAARDWKRATILIRGVSEDPTKRPANVTLLRWLQLVPDDELRADLYLYRRYCQALLGAGKLEPAEGILVYLAQAHQADTNLRGEVASLQANIAIRRGDMPRTLRMAKHALSLLSPDNFGERSRAKYLLGVVLFERALFDQAWTAFSEAYQTARLASDRQVACNALCYLGLGLQMKGELHAAVDLSRQAIELAGNSPASALARHQLAGLLYEWNDIRAATGEERLAVALFDLQVAVELRPQAHLSLAVYSLANGDLSGVGQELERVDEMLAQGTVRPAFRWFVAACRVIIALRQNNTTALKWPDGLPQYANHLPFQVCYVAARLMIARGEKTEAAKQLRDWHEKAVRVNAKGLTIKIRVCQALAAATPVEAVTFLADALRLGQPEGFVRTFVDERKLLAPLLREAMSRGITPAYARKLLNIIADEERQRQLRSSEATVPPSDPLSERELEILRLVAAGLSNPEIAEKLIIAVGTAKTHVHHIFEKLSAKDRLEAVTKAKGLNLI